MNTTLKTKTLLQRLLLKTLPFDTDPVLRSYIEIIVPELEKEFSCIYALGGDEKEHYKRLILYFKVEKAKEIAQKRASKPDQNLLVHVINALFILWKLIPHLPVDLQLTEIEKYLLCLAITLHDYVKYLYGHDVNTPRAYEVPEILLACQNLGEKLNFDSYWPEWKKYLKEIAYLAQNTQFKSGTNFVPSNWVINGQGFLLDDRRLELPLRHLLAFGDLAVHLSDPADIQTQTSGQRLREHLRYLGIQKKLIYHRLRDCRGLLTNGIHNIMLHFAKKLEWQPIIYLAQGTVYLAPPDPEIPDLATLQEFIWKNLEGFLSKVMQEGEIGFKRDGKGIKVAPQALEVFSPADLIQTLPKIVEITVRNEKNPATPKRLEKLELNDTEKDLFKYADLRSDRIAEFLILAQREFFPTNEDYATWILEKLQLSDRLTPAQTQIQSGGVNYGWYQVAAHYIANNSTWDYEQVKEALENLAQDLATWGEENNALPKNASPTRDDFYSYLAQYLDVLTWDTHLPLFEQELITYTTTKTQNRSICSLSSGEFAAEDQMDSVVMFKPQQYSNKNPLGGRRIKRGISKIWSLEMLLRQARWSARGGQLEDQQAVFLYIFPAYVYSPETIAAVRYFIEEFKDINLWKAKDSWIKAGMHTSGLQNLILEDTQENQQIGEDQYSKRDLPFMATTYTKTKGKTIADAWVKPTFLALVLPILLGVKVVATASPNPIYASDSEFVETVKLDGVAGFWNLLGLDASLRLSNLETALKRLLIAYCIHLNNRSNPPDARWQAFNGTVKDLATDVLNIFAIAYEGLRRNKKEHPSYEEVFQYWKYADIWSQGDQTMTDKLKVTKKLVEEYRKFYQVELNESSHSILLPISKALETILSVPDNWDEEELIFQGSGQLQDALDRQEVKKRPLIKDKSVDYSTRQAQELEAIQAFMTTCVKELFGQMCKGDRALLQENRNRIKSGVEFAYRLLALQEKCQVSKAKN